MGTTSKTIRFIDLTKAIWVFVIPAMFAPSSWANSNDTCRTAQVISSFPVNESFDTSTATADGPAGTCNYGTASKMQHDVWFTYTAVGNGTLDVTIAYGPPYYDGIAVVYSGADCNSLSQVLCHDDPQPAVFTVTVTEGLTYWFQIGSWGTPGAAGGNTTLHIESKIKYSGGTGDPCDPYRIGSKADLLALRVNPGDYNKNFILTADINLTGESFTTAVIAPDTPNSSSLFDGTAFTGIFDGKGHKITGLTINGGKDDCYVGLFGWIGAEGFGGTVKNLGLVNCDVNSYGAVGGLAGAVGLDGSVWNCYSTGFINGKNAIGGLVGENSNGSISNCYSTCTVSGYLYVGGLVGSNWGYISDSYSSGETSGNYDIGGLAGFNNGSVWRCNSNGNVNGGAKTGGLVGNNDNGTISNCYSICKISGNWYVGGLVGNNNIGNVLYCYSISDVNGVGSIGGLVGDNNGSTVSNCYSTGTVSGSGNYIGGLVGFNGIGTSVSNCYSNSSVIPTSAVYYVGGLIGHNYGNVSNCSSSGAVKGNSYYVGGLLGGNEGMVSRCYSTGPVNGRNGIGGFVGRALGSSKNISNCYAQGDVNGNSHVGGLIGYSENIVSKCYSTGKVTGTGTYVAGLVGQNTNSVSKCFWNSQIQDGISVGVNGGSISNVSGCTTAQMWTQSTYTATGYSWDFVGELINGTEDIWSICESTNYPRLTSLIPVWDYKCPDGCGFEDYSVLAASWQQINADINLIGDQNIDFEDLVILCDNWLAGR